MTSNIISLLAIVASLVVYLLSAYRAKNTSAKDNDPQSFFLARGAADEEEFAGAQIAYALQMQTIIPFFAWGFSGEWWLAAWNCLFYAVGILLLWLSINKFDQLSPFISGGESLHGIIGRVHQSKSIRKTTAWMTVIAFSGLVLYELSLGAAVFRELFDGSQAVYFFSLVLLGLFLLSYLLTGGQRAAIRSDQYQLLFGYIGLHAVLGWVIARQEVSIESFQAPLLLLILAIGSCCVLVRRFQGLWRTNHLYIRILHCATLISLAAIVWVIVGKSGALSIRADANFSSPDGVAIGWKLAALSLLPVFGQFVDMTNWQRMKSLSRQSDKRSGLFSYLIESPLSWILPLVLGMSVAQLPIGEGQDPWGNLLKYMLAQTDVLSILVSALFLTGVVAIFMSTADGLLTAIGYTFAFDLVDRSKQATRSRSPKSNAYVITVGRRGIIAAMCVVTFLFILIEATSEKGGLLIGLLLSFYGPMVSFAPLILVPVFAKRVASAKMANFALLAGGISGLAIGFYSVFAGGIAVWLGILVSIVLSWTIYIFGVCLGGKPAIFSFAETTESA